MLFSSLLLLAAEPAGQVAVVAAAQTKQGSAGDDEGRLICKSQRRSNSRFEKRVCRTKADLDIEAAKAREQASELINRPAMNPPEKPF